MSVIITNIDEVDVGDKVIVVTSDCVFDSVVTVVVEDISLMLEDDIEICRSLVNGVHAFCMYQWYDYEGGATLLRYDAKLYKELQGAYKRCKEDQEFATKVRDTVVTATVSKYEKDVTDE